MGADRPRFCYPGVNAKEVSTQLGRLHRQEYELGGIACGTVTIVKRASAGPGVFFRRNCAQPAPVKFMRCMVTSQSHGYVLEPVFVTKKLAV